MTARQGDKGQAKWTWHKHGMGGNG